MFTMKSFVNRCACVCVWAHVYLLYMQPCRNGLIQPNQHLFSNNVCIWRVELIALILSVGGGGGVIWDVTMGIFLMFVIRT